jgi:RNA polymerase sigma-70 factor (ECF subfamily)
MTLSDVELLQGRARQADDVLQMDEEAFRALYEQTARGVWAYLSRITGDAHLADDLLQETYYRFLRARAVFETDDHRRNYLFRIATNLVRDTRRRNRAVHVALPDEDGPSALSAPGDVEARAQTRADLSRAMAKLRPRDRSLLWLAYGQGASHREIAEILDLKAASIKLLLFRARRRLARLLRLRPGVPARVWRSPEEGS